MSQVTDRLSREELFYQIAELWAQRSTCLRGQVGAVATLGTRIIGSGYNGAPSGMPHCTEVGCVIAELKEYKPGRCTRAVHAEANLIAFCAKTGIALEGSELWCTHSPCPDCAMLIISAGFRAVHFREIYTPYEGVNSLNMTGIAVYRGMNLYGYNSTGDRD